MGQQIITPLGRSLRSMRAALIGVGAVSAVSNVLMLTGPLFMLQIYDRVLASGSVPTLIVLSGLVIALYFCLGLFEVIRARILLRLGEKLDQDIGKSAFAAALDIPLKAPGEKNRVAPVRDLDQVRQFLGGQGPIAIFDVPWLPLYLIIVFAFHPWLGWLATGGALVLIIITVTGEFVMKQPLADSAKATAQRDALLGDGERASEAIHALGMRGAYTERWAAGHAEHLQSQRRVGDHMTMVRSVTKVFRLFLQSAVLAVGAYLAIQQTITPGVMIAASIITTRAIAPVEQAVGQWRPFLSARQAYRRLEGLLAITSMTKQTVPLPTPKDRLDVIGLFVSAPGSTTPLVKNAHFGLQAGEALGVIGPSGSGKSSLARALVGIWPPAKGSVRLDGAELTQWPSDTLGRSIGYLPQEASLFEGTVAENIARFDPGADAGDIIAAAQGAGAHELILSLPEGYGTHLGVGGINLSAGQKQRVGLARALYGDPFLLVMDEPNANLDSVGDKALAQAVARAKERGAIVVVAAHRPSALAKVDKVLVLNGGAQMSFGPRDEVLQKATVVPMEGAA